MIEQVNNEFDNEQQAEQQDPPIKYLYNNKVYQQSDIDLAAKENNLDAEAYVKKAGFKVLSDNYSYNGKSVSAEDVLIAANENKMDFDTYVTKAKLAPQEVKKKYGSQGFGNGLYPFQSNSQSKEENKPLATSRLDGLPEVPKNLIDEAMEVGGMLNATKKQFTSTSPDGTTDELDVPDEQKRAQGMVKADEFKKNGVDVESIYNEIKDIPQVLFNQPEYNKQHLMQMREQNMPLYLRHLANTKVQLKLQEHVNNANEDDGVLPQDKSQIQGNINLSFQNLLTGEYSQRRERVKELSTAVDKFGKDDTDKMRNDLQTDVAKVYGSAWETGLSNAQDENSQYFNDHQLIAYNFIQDTDLNKAAGFESVKVDPMKISNEQERKGWEKKMYGLEQTGISIEQNNIEEEINNINTAKEKQGGELTSEQQIRGEQLITKYNENIKAQNNLPLKYKTVEENKIDIAVQELLGEKYNMGARAIFKVGEATVNTIRGAGDILYDLVATDENSNLRELELMGIGQEDAAIGYVTQKGRSLKTAKLSINEDIKPEIDAIVNNTLMSKEEKKKQLYSLLRTNPNATEMIPLHKGELNINPTTILNGVVELGAAIIPFIALEMATGGIGGAGAAARFARTFNAAFATGYHQNYISGLEQGMNRKDAKLWAMRTTAIQGAAMAGAGTLGKVKEMFNPKTPIGKAIITMTDAEFAAASKGGSKVFNELSKTFKTKGVFGSVKEVAKEMGSQGLNGLKTGVEFEGMMGAAQIGNAALDNQKINPEEFAKERLVGVLNFGAFAALTGGARKAFDISMGNVTDIQKGALLKATEDMEGYIKSAQDMVSGGLLSPKQFTEILENIKLAGQVSKTISKVGNNGKPLSERAKADLLFLETQKAVKEKALKEKVPLPVEEKTKAEIEEIDAAIEDVYKDKPIQPIFGAENPRTGVEKDGSLTPAEDVPAETNLASEADIKLLEQHKENGLIKGITTPEMQLKTIAMQGQNVMEGGTESKLQSSEQAYETAVRAFEGDSKLVDAAIAMFPKESLLGKEQALTPVIEGKTTVSAAVIEIGGKMYEGKNHAEAILKAKADGQDISQVNRQAQGKFKLSDGTIINRAEAKKIFGQDRSELMIEQDAAADQANKDYRKITEGTGSEVEPIIEGGSFDVAKKEYESVKEKYNKYLKKDGAFRVNTPENVKKEIDDTYENMQKLVKVERERKVAADNRDTGLISGMDRIRNNEDAMRLVSMAMKRGFIGERQYNEFGKNLLHIIGETNQEVTLETAGIVSDFLTRSNIKIDETVARELQAAENLKYEVPEETNTQPISTDTEAKPKEKVNDAGQQKENEIPNPKETGGGANEPPNKDGEVASEGEEEDMTKMANAVNDKQIKGRFGTDALDTVISLMQDTNLQNIWAAVKQRIQKGTLKAKDVRDRIIIKGEGSEQDQAVLMYDLAELKGKESELTKQINLSNDSAEIKELQNNLMDVQNEMMDNALANRSLGRTASTIFRLRQLWVNREKTLLDMHEEYKAANVLKQLTPEQELKIKSAYDEIKLSKQKVAELKIELDNAIKENETLKLENNALNKLTNLATVQKKADRKISSNEAISKSKEREKKVKEDLKKLRGGLNDITRVLPKTAFLISKLAAEKVYQGVVKFDKLVKDILDDVKDIFPDWTEKDVAKHILAKFDKNGNEVIPSNSQRYLDSKELLNNSNSNLKEKIAAYEEAQKHVALKQFEWQKSLRMDTMKNRPLKERIIDSILRWQRFAVLSYPSTFVKLVAVVAHQLTLKPLKFGIQYGISKLMPQGIKDKQAVWGETNLSALAKYYSAFVKNMSFTNLKEQFSGIDTKELLYGKPMMYDEFNASKGILEMPGRSHGYVKSFIKNPEFSFAHEQQVKFNLQKMFEIQNKLDNAKTQAEKDNLKLDYDRYDVTNEDVMERINKISLEHGKWSILMNDNKFVDKFQSWTRSNGAVGALIKSELPIVKIPFNYIGRAFATKYGLIKAITGSKWYGGQLPSVFSIIKNGTKSLSESQAELLGKTLNLGSIGASFFVLGYLGKNQIVHNDDGSVDIFGYHISKNLSHLPEYESLFSGASTAHKFSKSTEKNIMDWVESFVKSDTEIAKKNPFANMLTYGFLPNIATVLMSKQNDDKKQTKILDAVSKKITDMSVPGFVKQTAQWMDTNEKGIHPLGEINKRKPQGTDMEKFWQTFELAIPKLRENVPISSLSLISTPLTELIKSKGLEIHITTTKELNLKDKDGNDILPTDADYKLYLDKKYKLLNKAIKDFKEGSYSFEDGDYSKWVEGKSATDKEWKEFLSIKQEEAGEVAKKEVFNIEPKKPNEALSKDRALDKIK